MTEKEKTMFNHKTIAELSNMAALRNHLFMLSQNRNISSISEANELRSIVSKIDKEIVRRTLAKDLEKKTQTKKTATKTSKKSSSKKKTVVKRSES